MNMERRIFDKNMFLGREGFMLSIEDYMVCENLTKQEIFDIYTENEIAENAMIMMDTCRALELSRLKKYLSTSEDNPLHGNSLIVKTVFNHPEGTSHDIAVYESIDALIGNSDSHLDRDMIDTIVDKDGSLHLYGIHNDSDVDIEIRQLTDSGVSLNRNPLNSSVNALMSTWDEPNLCQLPRYAELAPVDQGFKSPFNQEEFKVEDGVDCAALEAAARSASECCESGRDEAPSADIAI